MEVVQKYLIRHTVAFKLSYPSGSNEEVEFLKQAQELSSISVVNNFECLRQIGRKNDFNFGLSMEFESVDDYEEYNNHPDHVRFVKDVWIPSVEEFMEVDYEAYEQNADNGV